MHYHRGMAAGENTLNAVVARLGMRTLTQAGRYDTPAFLAAYVAFMTTPGSHNDTYAETYHRMFFKNWQAGRKPADCADDDGHNVASMGGFVLLPIPALFAAASMPVAGGRVGPATTNAAQAAAVTQMYATHKSAELERNARVYASLLTSVLYGEDLRTAVAAAGRAVGHDVTKWASSEDVRIIGGTVSSACYIADSFPALLFLAYKYADAPEQALIANTNVGGENCHRGSALGALLGAAHGMGAWPGRWTEGLHDRVAIEGEANAFADLCASRFAAAANASGPEL
jgi:ADP-ribosylglycohydrolase